MYQFLSFCVCTLQVNASLFFFVSSAHIFIPQIYIPSPFFFTDDTLLQGYSAYIQEGSQDLRMENCLLAGGIEVLIKAVTQAILYVMFQVAERIM